MRFPAGWVLAGLRQINDVCEPQVRKEIGNSLLYQYPCSMAIQCESLRKSIVFNMS